uniref:rRNA N-glycosylase n=1 Tax=Oryza glumipatula TaxID=40148 RepID=A0A0E0AZN3_9ORYZ
MDHRGDGKEEKKHQYTCSAAILMILLAVSLAAALGILVVSLVAVLAPYLAQPQPASASAAVRPSVHVGFNLTTETYNDLYSKLHRVLTEPSNPPYDPTNVRGRYVLGEKRRPDFFAEPLRWIMVDLVVGGDGGKGRSETKTTTTTLALPDDDLRIIGFANGAGHWHLMPDFAGGLPGPVTTLPISHNYADLIDGGNKNLWKVPLGKQSAMEAVVTLASYDAATTTVEELRRAYVRLQVMISEALRFRAIRKVFGGRGRWEEESFIGPDQAEYVPYWGQLSHALVRWQQSGFRHWPDPDSDLGKSFKDINISNAKDAWNIVDFLGRP